MDKISILITEDEPIIAADLEDRLTEAGYKVLACFMSGEETLAFLETQVPDLLLMDIRLDGELDGIETVQQIVKKHRLPIIYLTSNTDKATFDRAKATKPHAFIGKPFRGKDLQYSIELAISQFSKEETEKVNDDVENKENSYFLKDRIFIKEKDSLIRVLFKDILWIEADSYYCKIQTTEKSYLITMTLKKLTESQVLPDWLVRVHRSFVVNAEQIEGISSAFVKVQEQKIPVGNSYRNNLKRYLQVL